MTGEQFLQRIAREYGSDYYGDVISAIRQMDAPEIYRLLEDNPEPRRKQRNNKTGYVGVTWNASRKRYRAQISVMGKLISIGAYKTKHEAAVAYNRACLQHGRLAPNKIKIK